IQPESDSAVCPVGAMRALKPDPFGPVFRSAPDRRLSRQGLVWIVTNGVEAAGIDPTSITGGLPRLNGGERRELSSHLTRGPAADVRDRALITNLYWGCFRASELVERTWRQARFVEQGIEWRIPRAKTDQDGAGVTIGVPRHANPWLCPVLALDEWKSTLQTLVGRPIGPNDPIFPTLDRRSRLTGPMRRDAANDAVKRAAARAGLTGDFGSHSLRSGFTTDAIDAGAKREHVQHHGRWKNTRSLDPYYRKTNTWGETNPAVHLANSAD
ncbi:MAG: tyrosine-type recombinase/integrase, partial [Actinomycetota bacterium]|nr:tyrosine-type recombinase/integrase [Actinomycetota bacterium]